MKDGATKSIAAIVDTNTMSLSRLFPLWFISAVWFAQNSSSGVPAGRSDFMEMLISLRSCQFALTLNLTTGPQLDYMNDIVLGLSNLHSTLFVLDNLRNYRRHLLRTKHQGACVLHVVFHIPALNIVELTLPYIHRGLLMSINQYSDLVFLLVKTNQSGPLIKYAFPDPQFYSDIPLNYVVLEWYERTLVGPTLQQLTLATACPNAGRICLKPWTTELFLTAATSYNEMVTAFQNRRQNLAGSSVSALMPSLEDGNKVILEGSWSYFSSFRFLPFREAFRQPAAATTKPLLYLSERFNFTFFGSQKYWNNFHDSRIIGQVSAVAIGISNSDSDIYNVTAVEFQTTVRYMLVYSTDASRNNPEAMRSLLSPFSLPVWLVLIGQAGLVTFMFYVKLRSSTFDDVALLTFIPFVGQAIEKTATRDLKFWYTAWTVLVLMIVSHYLAVIQSSVTVPEWNSGQKTLHQLINEKYQFYARRRTMQVINGIIALSRKKHDSFSYRAVFDDSKGLKNLIAVSSRILLLGGHNITQKIHFIQLKSSVLVGQDTHLKIFQRMANTCSDRSYKVSNTNDDLANFRVYWSFNNMRNGDVIIQYFRRLICAGLVRYWRKTAFLTLGKVQVYGFKKEMKSIEEGREILRRKGYFSTINPQMFSVKMSDSLMMESLCAYCYGLGLALMALTGEYFVLRLANAVANVKNAAIVWTLLPLDCGRASYRYKFLRMWLSRLQMTTPSASSTIYA